VLNLSCPVRGCSLPLQKRDRALVCEAGHCHDLARRGYANLLQPQDKKSGDPGDRREAVEARRRTAERGLTRELIRTLEDVLTPVLAKGGALLDVGCGDGFILDALERHLCCEAWGTDLSRECIELAAKSFPRLSWVIANGDRRLPFADGSFRAVLSITGPKNAAEYRRLLEPDGRLIVAVSGPDDQAELRELVLGAAHAADRSARMLELFGEHFEWESTIDARQSAELDRSALRDLLDGAYRGVRHGARERFDAVHTMKVTLSHVLVVFRPRTLMGPGSS
jgi:23S rRNA (guanine745-N1)-methyltransferase